jgi:glycosyltransferase involved in cell wall biosynthesis
VRVLEVTQRFAPAIGGVERHVERLSVELERAGLSVEVVTSDLLRDRPFARLPRPGPGDPVPVRRHRAVRFFPAPHGLGIVAPGLVDDVLTRPADVVHAHAFGYPPTWAGVWRRRLRRTPLILTAHSDAGRGTRMSQLYARAVARSTLARADRVVALTQTERSHLARLGVPDERIVVIPNGVDLDEFSAEHPLKTLGAPFVVLYLGRLYPEQKGIATLLEAFASMSRSPAPELRLVGEDWGGLALVDAAVRLHSLGASVVTTGVLARDAVLRELARADVLVLPSTFEPFGIVLLEAMASGLPVVASNVGGIPEIVRDGETGFLVPPRRPSELAAALERLRSDPSLGRRMGAAGRRRVEEFSWKSLAPKFVALFEDVASAR